MVFFDVAVLALIQGITEFLPVSSSGHLVLWPILTGRPDQGVTMDVAVHLGTLAAVCLYFRREARSLLTGLKDLVSGESQSNAARFFVLVAVASVPVIAAGFYLKLSGLVDALRALEVIGWATLIGGVLMWIADRAGPRVRDLGGWRLKDAALMGFAQALALIPGTSRSGITMTMARALGFERTEAARLSMLMAMPVILAAVALEAVGLVGEGGLALSVDLALGAVLSFVAALAALSVMMHMFSREWTMLPFVLYRLALGGVLLGIAYL